MILTAGIFTMEQDSLVVLEQLDLLGKNWPQTEFWKLLIFIFETAKRWNHTQIEIPVWKVWTVPNGSYSVHLFQKNLLLFDSKNKVRSYYRSRELMLILFFVLFPTLNITLLNHGFNPKNKNRFYKQRISRNKVFAIFTKADRISSWKFLIWIGYRIQYLSNTKWLLKYFWKDVYLKKNITSLSSTQWALIKAFADVIK